MKDVVYGKNLLVIDEGTTGVKVSLFDETGIRIIDVYREYPSIYLQNGSIEQSVEEIRRNIIEAIAEVIKRLGDSCIKIASISLASQGTSYIFLDDHDNLAFENAISWQDTRSAEYFPLLATKIGGAKYYEITGSPIGAFNCLPSLWLKAHCPEAWKKVKRVCTHQDYFLSIFGADRHVCDVGSAQRTGIFDINSKKWDPDLIKFFGFEGMSLPEIEIQSGVMVGRISDSFSEMTGLPFGIPIFLGAHDVTCSCFGTGGQDKDTSTLVVGTLGGVYSFCDEMPKACDKAIHVKLMQGINGYQLESFSHTAASSFRWFRDQLCVLETDRAKRENANPYDLIVDLASTSSPGSNGVTAITSLQGSYGRIINEKAKGSFLGITLGTKKSDLARSVMEGICFELYDLLQIQKEYGATCKKIRLAGGARKNAYWAQMFADIFGVIVEITREEPTAIGAAMYSAVGLGLFADLSEAEKNWVKIERAFTPNAETHRAYESVYRRWKKANELLNSGFYL